MGRLSTLKPKLRALRSTVYVPEGSRERERYRAVAAPWRAWYGLARWKRLRKAVLLRDLYTCQMCGRLQGDTSQLVADHRVPHRGDERLFFDEGNLWTLCKSPCHDQHKQRLEVGGRLG